MSLTSVWYFLNPAHNLLSDDYLVSKDLPIPGIFEQLVSCPAIIGVNRVNGIY
jgi:hypothetical protein